MRTAGTKCSQRSRLTRKVLLNVVGPSVISTLPYSTSIGGVSLSQPYPTGKVVGKVGRSDIKYGGNFERRPNELFPLPTR